MLGQYVDGQLSTEQVRQRMRGVRNAITSIGLSGGEPTAAFRALLERYARGEITIEQVMELSARPDYQ